MKRILLKLVLAAILGATFCSCTEDSPYDGPKIPSDQFTGDLRTFKLGHEVEKFDIVDSVICHISTEDGTLITRKCVVHKDQDTSTVNMNEGLKNGVYRLLYFEYFITDDSGETVARQFGLGCRIKVTGSSVEILDVFDKTLQMSGSGTEEDPYIVTCGPHLYNLTLGISDFYEYDRFIGAYFRQVADISLHDASYYCKHESGWIPIGNSIQPFTGTYDGGGHKVKNIYSLQTNMVGVGLFGHICNASVQNLTIEDSEFTGLVGVGAIAGCLMTASGEHCVSTIINCTVRNCKIKCVENGYSAGGVAGIVDMYTAGLIAQCNSLGNEIESDYNAGGVVGSGSAYSLTTLDLCTNSSNVKSNYSGAGGIIGVADTLSVSTSTNSGVITGAIKYTE